MQKKMLCFDLDGTIADLYNVDNWLDKLIASDASPYRDAKPLCNMEELTTVLRKLAQVGWEVCVISWCAKNSSKEFEQETKRAKLDWMNKYSFFYNLAHIVSYGMKKSDCVRADVDFALLFDDDPVVRDSWDLGETIDPNSRDIVDFLNELLLKN